MNENTKKSFKNEEITNIYCSYKDESKKDWNETEYGGNIINIIKYKKWNGQYPTEYFQYEKRD